MPSLKIASGDLLIDQPLPIEVCDLEPNAVTTVRAAFYDDFGQAWASYAEFIASGSGSIDLRLAKPQSGTYSDADLMGLFWSMQLQNNNPDKVIPFPNTVTESLKPLTVTLSVEQQGGKIAEAVVTRRFLAEGVTKIDIREAKLVATLFIPAFEIPQSAPVLVLGGSGGGFGWSHQVAALLASYGCVSLAIGYFDWNGRWGLPRELVEIPLETFSIAIAYLKAHFRFDLENLGLIGYSKGAELGLLLATTYPEIKHLVAYAPSSVVWQGIQRSQAASRSSWSYQNRPLPFVEFPDGYFDKAGWNDDMALNEAVIPVERTSAALLLISGTHDGVWPSTKMGERITQRLEELRHNKMSRHLRFEGAGHNLSVPYLPSVAFDGATRALNATAECQAWQAVKDFLSIST